MDSSLFGDIGARGSRGPDHRDDSKSRGVGKRRGFDLVRLFDAGLGDHHGKPWRTMGKPWPWEAAPRGLDQRVLLSNTRDQVQIGRMS